MDGDARNAARGRSVPPFVDDGAIIGVDDGSTGVFTDDSFCSDDNDDDGAACHDKEGGDDGLCNTGVVDAIGDDDCDTPPSTLFGVDGEEDDADVLPAGGLMGGLLREVIVIVLLVSPIVAFSVLLPLLLILESDGGDAIGVGMRNGMAAGDGGDAAIIGDIDGDVTVELGPLPN